MSQLELGDVVVLKSGGPLMTVSSSRTVDDAGHQLPDGRQHLEVIWFDVIPHQSTVGPNAWGQLQRFWVPDESLSRS